MECCGKKKPSKTVGFICKECGVYFVIPLWRFKDKGKRIYCSKQCRLNGMKGGKNWKWKGGLDSRRPKLPNSASRKPIYWAIVAEHYPKKCNRCYAENDLQVHHKDRNRKNNYYENLEYLCRSCHSKEHKFHKNFKKVSH